jgi:hypothetical protein
MMGNLRSPGVILLLTLFLYGTAGGASPDQGSAGRRIDRSKDLCKLQKDYFTLQFQNRLSVPRLAERIAGRDSSVILIGETHSEADNRYYPFFLEKLKNAIPALDCVTFELDEQIQYPVEYSAERWQILAERAKELGLNVFKVDHCDQAQDIFHDLPCLDGRNAFMSARLKSLRRTEAAIRSSMSAVPRTCRISVSEAGRTWQAGCRRKASQLIRSS